MDQPGGWLRKRMRRTVVAVVLAPALAACSLLTNLDGLRGTDGSPDGGSAEGSATGDRDGAPSEASEASGASLTYESAVLADRPLAYFPFDDAPGTTARDRMGGSPGTYTTTGVAFQRSGAVKGSAAIALDGTNGRVSLGDRFSFTGRAPFSIEVWVNPSVLDNRVRWIAHRGSGDPALTNSFGIYMLAVKSSFQRLSPGGDSYAQGPALVTSKFVHIVATFDGSRSALYVDGALFNVGNAGAGEVSDVPGSEFVIGDVAMAQPSKLGGVVDELAIYDKALGAERVKAHFDAAQR